MAVKHVTNQNFETEVAKQDVPVIMDFWANWCMPCQMMGPIFEELSNDYDGKLKFVKVNTEEERSLPGMFNITGIPALIITKDGKEVDRIVGFAPKEALKQQIDQILSTI